MTYRVFLLLLFILYLCTYIMKSLFAHFTEHEKLRRMTRFFRNPFTLRSLIEIIHGVNGHLKTCQFSLPTCSRSTNSIAACTCCRHARAFPSTATTRQNQESDGTKQMRALWSLPCYFHVTLQAPNDSTTPLMSQ